MLKEVRRTLVWSSIRLNLDPTHYLTSDQLPASLSTISHEGFVDKGEWKWERDGRNV